MNKKIEYFVSDDINLEVTFDNENNTIWLTKDKIATLFNISEEKISSYIENAYKEEKLDESLTSIETTLVYLDGNKEIKRKITKYNIDMIILIGYCVDTKKAILFRKWVNSIFNKYFIEGFVTNEKRLSDLNKQINIIPSSKVNHIINEDNKILQSISEYNKALLILDDYDHQTLSKPNGTFGCYRLTYKECREIIDSMKFESTIFGVEKDGSFNSSINAIYQSAFGEDIYKSTEEKAANLLYFITKNHSFVDGNKRIAASIFIYFLDKNNLLYINGNKRLSDSALVAITILIAESKPDEKEIIIKLIMNFLTMYN